MTLPIVPNNRTDEAELKYTESCPGWAECCTEYGYCQPKVNMKWHFFHQHLKLFQLTTVGLGGEVVPRLQWREQWLGGNLKLENIFSKSNLVDGSFHFSFLMKQRLQSLKLPAMATKELNQNNSVDTILFKEGPPPKKKWKELELSLKQLAPLYSLMKNSIKF